MLRVGRPDLVADGEGEVEQPQHAGHLLVVVEHRQDHRVDAVAEDPLEHGDRLVEVGPGQVELGHDEQPGEPGVGRLLPPQREGRVHPLGGRQHEDDGVAQRHGRAALQQDDAVGQRAAERADQCGLAGAGVADDADDDGTGEGVGAHRTSLGQAAR